MCDFSKFIVGALFCMSLIISSNIYARQLVEHDGLRATVDKNFSCARNISVNIDTANARAFQGNRVKLQQLLGGVRAALSFECDNIKRINIVGRANGRVAYHAYAQDQNNWRLTEMQPKINTATTNSPTTFPAELKAPQKILSSNNNNQPQLPDTLNNFYVVDQSGEVTQLAGKDLNLNRYVRLPSIRRGEYVPMIILEMLSITLKKIVTTPDNSLRCSQ